VQGSQKVVNLIEHYTDACNLCYAFWYPTKKYLFIADLKESKLGVESQGWSGSEFQAIKLPTENAHQPNLL